MSAFTVLWDRGKSRWLRHYGVGDGNNFKVMIRKLYKNAIKIINVSFLYSKSFNCNLSVIIAP